MLNYRIEAGTEWSSFCKRHFNFTFIPLNNVGCRPILSTLLRFHPNDPLDTNWTVAWRWTGNRPLCGPIVAYFTGAYICNLALMIYKVDWMNSSFCNWVISWIDIYTIIVNVVFSTAFLLNATVDYVHTLYIRASVVCLSIVAYSVGVLSTDSSFILN